MTDDPGFLPETLETYEPTPQEVAARAVSGLPEWREAVEEVREARAKIVKALNLSPLVPPQADTETLNVVDDAWAALSKLIALADHLEALMREMREARV